MSDPPTEPEPEPEPDGERRRPLPSEAGRSVPRRDSAGSSPAESAFDWCFRNRHTGQITIAQFPNIALAVFLASVVAGWLVPEGTTAHRVVEWIGVAALGWWAVDELIRGVNPWRRLLGIGGIALTISGIVRLLPNA